MRTERASRCGHDLQNFGSPGSIHARIHGSGSEWHPLLGHMLWPELTDSSRHCEKVEEVKEKRIADTLKLEAHDFQDYTCACVCEKQFFLTILFALAWLFDLHDVFSVSHAVVDLACPKSSKESPATGQCRGIAFTYTMQLVTAKKCNPKVQTQHHNHRKHRRNSTNINQDFSQEKK